MPARPGGEAERTADLIERQSALLERALAALGERPPATGQTERAFQLLDRTLAELEDAKAALSARSADPAALDLLARTMAFAEQRDADAHRLQGLLERALDGIAALEAAVAERDATIEKHESALNDLIAISERSLAAGEREALARTGFWGRLFSAKR